MVSDDFVELELVPDSEEERLACVLPQSKGNKVGAERKAEVIVISSSDSETSCSKIVAVTGGARKAGSSSASHYFTRPITTSSIASTSRLPVSGYRSFWEDEVDDPASSSRPPPLSVEPITLESISTSLLTDSRLISDQSRSSTSSKRKSDPTDESATETKVKRRYRAKPSGYQSASNLLRARSKSDSPFDVDNHPSDDLSVSLGGQNLVRGALGLPKLVKPSSRSVPGKAGSSSSSRRTLPANSEVENGTSEESEETSSKERMRLGIGQFKFDGGVTTSTRPNPLAVSISRHNKLPPKATGRALSVVSGNKLKMELPPNTRLSLLETCPLCTEVWEATKTVATKSTHLRSCAVECDYTAETVAILIENYIISLALEQEAQRRSEEAARSLLDRAIGKGEGIGVNRGVTIVGVEMESDIVLGWGVTDPTRITRVQNEIDEERNKRRVDKAVVVAKEIKLARKVDHEAARRQELALKATQDRLNMTQGAPRPTGLLKGDSKDSRKATVNRGGALLHSLGGSGLTQIVGGKRSKPVGTDQINVVDPLSVAEGSKGTIMIDDDVIVAPSTQPFAPSDLVRRFVKSGRGQASARSLAERRSIESDDDSDGEGNNSLWAAAAGENNQILDKIVSLPLPSPDRLVVSASSDEDGHRFAGFNRVTSSVELKSKPVEEMRMISPGSPQESNDGVLVWDGGDAARTVEVREERAWREETRVETSESDEDVQTAPKKIRKSRAKLVKEPVVSQSSSSDDSDAIDYLANAPDYASYSLAVLQTEAARYGFRISKSRSVLVTQLQKVWSALEQEKHAKLRKKEKKKSTAAKKRAAVKSKKGKKAKVADTEDNDSASEEEVTGETIGERLRKLIISDDELYSKVLRYEPIFFDEIVKLASDSKLKTSKLVLMKCLDEQSVTFYTQDPTGGSRRRF